ncbi:U-box domain-containing protein 44-like [Sesamum indicum]|uniref:U-box domain-containing protein 44-like n=1 Tax=Sesamum indicum TaxID=4182 RepID=A0A8M8UVS8_SESIN|nr:U-box domain-containing protein 44-like [Sesamum indicum]
MEESASSEQHSSCASEFGSSTLNSRSSSSMQTEPTIEFSVFIQKLSSILDEMKDSLDVTDLPAIARAMNSLEADYKHAKKVMDGDKIHSSTAKHVEYLIQNLGRSLGVVLFAGREVPMATKQKMEALCKEMMNVRFDVSSERESEFFSEDKAEKGNAMLSIDDAMVQIKYGNAEEFKNGLIGLNSLIMDGLISNDTVNYEDLIKVLCKRLSLCRRDERLTIIYILRYLVTKNVESKEKMKDWQILSGLVKLLGRDVEEQRAALGLLLSLSEDAGFRRRMGRIQGCIVTIVAICKGDDEEASCYAKELLNAISSNTQHVLHMAEAGYFKPLIKYLKEGSDMSKALMATALSRMELTDQNKATIGEAGAIEPLVEMFNTGNLEAKLSALNALQSLSNLKQNIRVLIDSGIVSSLFQLLFTVTSVLMTLREPASAILAKVAQFGCILVKQDVAHQMLSLLTLSSPVIQNHLLEALIYIAAHPNASKVRKRMKENRAIQLLVTFFTDTNAKIRSGALKLVHTLSKDAKEELTDQLGYTNINIIARIVMSATSDSEKASALGILSNLPISDGKITDLLKESNLMHVMASVMSSIHANPTSTTMQLAESIAGILTRFTVPTDKRLQRYSVENGVIPVLFKLLSISSENAKSNAAFCLAQLSQNSFHLSKSRKMKWLCIPPPEDALCEVHDGYCSAKSTFCLVKAGAMPPLAQVLDGNERGADEAVLNCISTLLHDEIWERGCDYIIKTSGVRLVIKVVEAECGESAQVVLTDVAQKGDPMLKPRVDKLLAQLQQFQIQSTKY